MGQLLSSLCPLGAYSARVAVGPGTGIPEEVLNLIRISESEYQLYLNTRNLVHLDATIHAERELLRLHPTHQPMRGAMFHSLGISFRDRFDQTRDLNDLLEAIDMHMDALHLRPPGHLDRCTSLVDLAQCLQARFSQTGNPNDVLETIGMFREALLLHPPGDPNRIGLLTELAVSLAAQLEHQDELRALAPALPDQDNAPAMSIRAQTIVSIMDLLREAARPSPTLLQNRLTAASLWLQYSRNYLHESQLEAMTASLDLVDESISQARSLQSLFRHVSKHEVIQNARTVASDATALASERGDVSLAVTLLERGRTMIFTQLGRFRQTLGDIQKTAPELAEKFVELSDTLNDLVVRGEKSAAFRKAAGDTTKDLGVVYYSKHSEWARAAAEIRQISGFESFMGTPSFEFLQRAAAGGPVILLNVNERRSDAIIIPTSGNPILISLPEATPDAISALAERLGRVVAQQLGKPSIETSDNVGPSTDKPDNILSILQRLWALIVHPIATQLQLPPISLRLGSRIWWCATGATSQLPLHAAGPYRPGEKNLSSLFISSYTPTLAALIRARQSSIANDPVEAARSILIVGQPDTPKEPPLLGVLKEVRSIQRQAPLATVLLSSEGTTEKVLSGFEGANWLHLSCHGHHNSAEPFESRFSMYDGPITLQNLMEKRLPRAEHAFLSACHSARASETLPDEVLHLAAGMMFAGYRSVIGTMWSFDDDLGSALTEEYYRLMFGGKKGPRPYSDSAMGLARAFDALEKAGHEIPLVQRINVVHYGV